MDDNDKFSDQNALFRIYSYKTFVKAACPRSCPACTVWDECCL